MRFTRASWLKKILRISYWILPLVILGIIFSRIDLHKLATIFRSMNPWLAILGLSGFPMVVLIGAWRWRLALWQFYGIRVPFREQMRYYWSALSIGIFSPGQLGMDAYRVIAMGRRLGRYPQNILVLVVEKIMALLTSAVIVISLFSAVTGHIVNSSEIVLRLLRLSYVVVLVFGALLVVFAALTRSRTIGRLLSRSYIYVQAFMNRIKKQKPCNPDDETIKPPDMNHLLGALLRPRPLLGIFFTSMVIQIIPAVNFQIFFLALGYDMPITVNMILVPLTFVILLFPISFGGLGIREVGFIVLYGMFGVPAEIALFVSFMGQIGNFLNIGIGAVMLWLPKSLSNAPSHDSAIRNDKGGTCDIA